MQTPPFMQPSPRVRRSRATRPLVVATMLGTGALFASGVLAATTDAAPEQPGERCFETTNEARYRPYGYDHYVIIRNGCVPDLLCSVSTNVNPGPIEVSVPSGATVEVLTYQRSPARTFTSTVTCSPEGG